MTKITKLKHFIKNSWLFSYFLINIYEISKNFFNFLNFADFPRGLRTLSKVILAIFIFLARGKHGRAISREREKERENLSQNFSKCHSRRSREARKYRREKKISGSVLGSVLVNGDNLKIDALVKTLPL